MQNHGVNTGMAEVDRLIGGIMPGDNLVWQADSGALQKALTRIVPALRQE